MHTSNQQQIASMHAGLKPLVSIITMVRNGVPFITQCLQSVLQQTYPHIEHIIVDGASSDGTVKILEEYAHKYPGRIRFISEPDRGTGDAWNKGLKIAMGDILGWIGSDDFYEPAAVEMVVSFFAAKPDAQFVYGGVNYIDKNGGLIKTYKAKPFNRHKLINEHCMIPTPSAFYKKTIFNVVGGFDVLGNDLDFFMKVANNFSIYSIDTIISNYRVHPGSQNSGTNLKLRLMWKREDCQVSRRHGSNFFSGYCRRYYKLVIVYDIQQFVNFMFTFLKKIQLFKRKPPE